MIDRSKLPKPNLKRGSSFIPAKTIKKLTGMPDPSKAINMQCTPVFTALNQAYEDGKTGIVMEGGSRSSKTHSIIQFIIKYAQENAGTQKRILIARKKSTWTTATVMHDFLNVLKFYKLFRTKDFNKTSRIYTLYDTEIWFGGLDDDQKLHGFQSDIFWINEAVEASKDDFDQLEQRLKGFFILDYNPSHDEHWIYERVCKRPDCVYHHSTMLMNPFIPLRSRNKILSYEPTEENYANGTADKNKWDIYGLGKRSQIEGVIFTNWNIVKTIPVHILEKAKKRYGLDLGYTNDPTAICEVYWSGNEIWLNEICYEIGMKSKHIADKIIVNGLKMVKGWCESADPRTIDEVYDHGCNVHKVTKEGVVSTIDILQQFKIHITENSINMITEAKNYKWMQDKNGKWLNKPIDDFNHLWDGVRYVATMELGSKESKTGSTADKAKIMAGIK